MWNSLCALALIGCLLPTTALAGETKSKIAVLNMTGTGVDASLLPTLTEILTVEVHQMGLYEVVSGRDIEAMLNFEEDRQAAGCDDAACLAEIGGALGVERILSGHLGMVGETFVVNIKLINIKEATTEDRVYETVAGKTDALIDVVRKSARRMLGPGSKAAGAVATTTATTTSTTAGGPDAGGGLPLWLPIATAAVGAVSVGVGVGFGLDASDSESKACEGCIGGHEYADRAQSSARLANLFYGVGAVALITGGVLFIFSGSDEPTSTVLLPTIGADSVALSLSGAF